MNEDFRIDFAVDRDFGEVMSKTLLFFQQNFRALASITFLLMGPIVVLYTIYESLIILSISDIQANGTLSDIFSEVLYLQAPLLIVFILAYIFYQAIIYTYLECYFQGTEKQMDNRQLLIRAVKKLLPMTAVYIILLLMSLISLITIIGPIYILVAASFCYIIFVHEDEGVFSSIGRSYDMIAGYWWETFALVLVLGILGYVISGVMSIPQAIVNFLIEFNQVGDNYENLATGLHILFGIVANMSVFIASIFGIIGVSLQYFSIREKKEMPGLFARIGKIGAHLQTGEDLPPDTEPSKWPS